VKLGGINEDEFSILLRRDGEFRFIDGGDTVANRNLSMAVSSGKDDRSFRVAAHV
jgi:hypothetical protein